MARPHPYLMTGLLGTGVAAGENELLGDNLPEELKLINLGIGGVTGGLMANPAYRERALHSWPFKQLGLFGIGSLDHFRRQQSDLADRKLETAEIEQDTAKTKNRDLKGLGTMLAALAGSGALAYYAYNQRKKPRKPTNYDTIGGKGKLRGSAQNRVKIDVPGSALPAEFFQSLVDIDDNPKARTLAQTRKTASAQDGGIGSTLWDMGREMMAYPSFGRMGRDVGSAAGNLAGGDFGEAARYGAGAVGNAAFGGLALQGLASMTGEHVFTEPRLRSWASGATTPGATANQAWMQRQFQQYPRLGRFVLDHSIDYDKWGDRLNKQFAYDPRRYAWHNPTVASGGSSFGKFFDRFLTRPKTPTTSLFGAGTGVAKWLANRGVNAGYGMRQFVGRHPLVTMFGAGLGLAGMGTEGDKSRRDEARDQMRESNFFSAPMRNGAPVSATLETIMNSLGAGRGGNPAFA